MNVAMAHARPVASARPRLTILSVTLAWLVFYMIAFPKGGIRIWDIPLTFGYIISLLGLTLAFLRIGRFKLPVDRLWAWAACMVLGIWSALAILANGTSSAGFTLAYFTSIVYLPLFGLIFCSGLILSAHEKSFEKAIKWSIRFVVAYGIFLFLFKMTTGAWIEIPYLTVNADDTGSLDDKYINRGGIFKLISTYNNGNIFGVTMCIIGPLYLRLENKRFLRMAYFVALVLTLSRTVWVGFIAILLMRALSQHIRPMTLLYLSVAALVGCVSIYYALALFGADMSFLFDRELGGRAGQLSSFTETGLVPHQPVAALPEIVYTGVVANYGYIGLLLFLVHLLVPAMIMKLEGVRVFDTTRASACMQGMLLYVVIAGSDAAFSYIPVMMVFWMVAGLGLWYRRYDVGGVRPA